LPKNHFGKDENVAGISQKTEDGSRKTEDRRVQNAGSYYTRTTKGKAARQSG
jgi:hypothetical protein